MNRSRKYLDSTQQFADSLLFLKNAKEEKAMLEKELEEYVKEINSNQQVYSNFPSLVKEIQESLVIQEFNAGTVKEKTDQLYKAQMNLQYISVLLNDLDKINTPVLREKLSLTEYKQKFLNAADKLVFRSVDTLHFEMQKFEELFRKVNTQLNAEKQKQEKVRSLIHQDMPLLTVFPEIEKALKGIADGETVNGMGTDYVITNYRSIRDSLLKLNEFSKYFSVLSKDYLQVLSGQDLQLFQSIKPVLSLSMLLSEGLRLSSLAAELKNRIIRLDTLRNQFVLLRREVNEKIGEVSPNHQKYIREEISGIQALLNENPGREFEKADQKIRTIRELLKKQFVANDQRASEAMYIRQMISRYETNIWQEDLTRLFEELNEYINGGSFKNKETFTDQIQSCIKEKNEFIEMVRSEYDVYFQKNRDYKNRFERIINTKCEKQELKQLINDMGSFKPLKNIFYKYIK
ncbi:MAG: hypothetical protein IPN39_07945 [Chitinophagaceae bacterium]|nr:hypothetical protein [Chitinophagaceae bacterium]